MAHTLALRVNISIMFTQKRQRYKQNKTIIKEEYEVHVKAGHLL